MPAYRLTAAAIVGFVTVLTLSAQPTAQQQADRAAQFAALNWLEGPTQGDLGGAATIQVPAGYLFLGRGDASRFMELNENPSDKRELGVLLNDAGGWFVVFEFSEDGYVRDDDRDLDADAILDSIRQGTEEANKVRRQRGWATMEIIGWQQRPFYDSQTNNLTWSIRGTSEGSTSINHSTRLLGRRGVMNLNLVMAPEDVGNAVPAFNAIVTEFSFNTGQKYAEFTRGDKVAEYGLTGLIVGGTGAALVKTGLLQKFWKFIVIGLVAVAGAIKRFVGSVGRGTQASGQGSHG